MGQVFLIFNFITSVFLQLFSMAALYNAIGAQSYK